MTTRFLIAGATLCAALAMTIPAEAAKKRSGIVLDKEFAGCAVWAPPACVMVGKYNVTGSGIVPGTLVKGMGKPVGGASICPGTVMKVSSFQTVGLCFWPGWPPR